jgi:hypothetical protein
MVILTTFVDMRVGRQKSGAFLSLYRFLPTNVVISPTFGFECICNFFQANLIVLLCLDLTKIEISKKLTPKL